MEQKHNQYVFEQLNIHISTVFAGYSEASNQTVFEAKIWTPIS